MYQNMCHIVALFTHSTALNYEQVTQFMILVEGFNNRQNQAIALAIEVQYVLLRDTIIN